MLIGVIADDFTGASDIANTLAKGVAPEGGLRTAQYSGVPDKPADPEIEAGVISLKSRSAPLHEAIADSLNALAWLRAQGCKQFLFKYCSTFDSTKEGNIGPVAEALAKELNASSVVVCPAFPGAGRTVYQGHLFVFDQLLNESGMQHHPVTPMSDPDIRRWLGHQVAGTIGHLNQDTVLKGPKEIKKSLEDFGIRGTNFVITDATSEDDLLALGKAVASDILVTGGSGIALGLPRNFINRGLANGDGVQIVKTGGPEVILAGSCSGATRGQVELHSKKHPSLLVDVSAVMENGLSYKHLAEFVIENQGRKPLIYSSSDPIVVKSLQSKFGRENVSQKLDVLFASTARYLAEQGTKRFVVAGGETSGAVAQALTSYTDYSAMTIGPEIDPGVPILTIGQKDPIALALKSGNFGSEDFFEKALKQMEHSD